VKKLMSHTEEIIAAEVARALRENADDSKRPRERIAISNQQGVLNLDIRRVLVDQVEVFDDRGPRPR
jgi:hypothetical protein